MTQRFQTIGTDAASEWLRLIREVSHDFYHLPQYHQLAEERGEGNAVLFAYAEDGDRILLPLLLRPIDAVEGLEAAGAGLMDATSVYGYPGPLASSQQLSPAAVLNFQGLLRARLQELQVVSLFSRLHPLLASFDSIQGLGDVRNQGRTVSIDLTGSEEEQFLSYRSNHRRDVRKLRQQGYVCGIEENASSLEEFVTVYQETMARVGAAAWYFFDTDYFRALLEIEGLALMVCRKEGAFAAGAILSQVGGIAQYHLGGTADAWLKAAPMKLVFDEARRWASSQGCSALHLGGGLGSGEDALFHFKAGFSDVLHDFSTWRWVVDERRYSQLVAAREQGRTSFGEEGGASSFFPAYRS